MRNALAIAATILAVAYGWPPAAAAAGDAPSQLGDTLGRLSLDAVIAEVVGHNDRALAARYMEDAAKAKIGPAGAWDDPMLMAGVTNLPTSFDFREDGMTMKMLGLSQSIPYAGQKGLQSQAARAGAEAARADRGETLLDLVAAAQSAYYDLYYRQQALDDLLSQRAILAEIVSTVQAGLAAGRVNQEDLAAAQADLWRADAQILSARQEVDAAGYALNALRGVAVDEMLPELAEPAIALPADSLAEWWDAAREHYPPLQRLAWEARRSGLEAAAARRMRWPMLGLSASYGFRESTAMERRGNMVGFAATLSLPLFSGRQQGRMARAMEAMRRQSEADAGQLWRDVQATLATLHQRSRRLRESLRLYREQIIPAAEEAYRSALGGYTANRSPLNAVLAYAVAIYRDRLSAIQTANELARTMSEVERYTGDPATLIPADEMR